MKRKLIYALIVLTFATGLLLLVCGLRGLLTEELPAKDVVAGVCDGFFIPGVLMLCMAGLVWASDQGVFDGLKFSLSTVFKVSVPQGRDAYRGETYADYKERKLEAKKKKVKQPPVMLITGAVFTVIAIILFIVYISM